MSLNDTPGSERFQIGFFGRTNAGKSSLVNAVTGQRVALVSPTGGTTTDPVKKAMEILPLGPVLLIDTPGFDDVSELGESRVERTREILSTVDAAVLVTDAAVGEGEPEKELIRLISARNIPLLKAVNKAEFLSEEEKKRVLDAGAVPVSAETGEGINALKERIASIGAAKEKKILAGLCKPGDRVILVIPIDESAPKGRIILPQQMVLRELLDLGALAVCCRDSELSAALAAMKSDPDLVITDSSVFRAVSAIVPERVRLTSFSILFARYRGDLDQLAAGADRLSELKDSSRVLIAEGCTHHRQCNDIGTVKLPSMISRFCGASPRFEFTSGGAFPEDLSGYDLVVHCGACMLSANQMKNRLAAAREAKVPIVNYGVAIARMTGILDRALAPLETAGG
ncbi:MAG: [Clostridia bacterium]|nr:[FeFe] hydrogenase H-cluster maturation GTPase HydF [Clostridia bacterium]